MQRGDLIGRSRRGKFILRQVVGSSINKRFRWVIPMEVPQLLVDCAVYPNLISRRCFRRQWWGLPVCMLACRHAPPTNGVMFVYFPCSLTVPFFPSLRTPPSSASNGYPCLFYCSGRATTSRQSKVVSYVAGLAGHWRLRYDSAKELMQPLAPAATFAGCLPVQVGYATGCSGSSS